MQTTKAPKLKTKRSKISYAKWGYIFIAPFFLAYALFHFAPQLLTIYNSFFENYREGLTQVGPNFVGLKNYITLFTPDKNGTIDILKYAGNTIVLWVCGAIPQVVISLMLACFFTSYRLKIKGQQFFKTVIYMPNLIMASAFAMLFYMLFSNVGPINQILTQLGWIDAPIDFFNIRFTVRGLIYTIITALIGGLQMFDVPQVLTNGLGTPNRTSTTLVMYLNNYLKTSKNYGMSGAISVVIFIITGLLSLVVFKSLTKQEEN